MRPNAPTSSNRLEGLIECNASPVAPVDMFQQDPASQMNYCYETLRGLGGFLEGAILRMFLEHANIPLLSFFPSSGPKCLRGKDHFDCARQSFLSRSQSRDPKAVETGRHSEQLEAFACSQRQTDRKGFAIFFY